MGEKVFSIIIWALLWATVVAPFAFRRVLVNFAKNQESHVQSIVRGESSACSVVAVEEDRLISQHAMIGGHRWRGGFMGACRVHIIFPNSPGSSCDLRLLEAIWMDLKAMRLVVTRVMEQADQDARYLTFRMQNRDGGLFEESHLQYIQEMLFNTLKNTGAHIVLFPQLNSFHDVCSLVKITIVLNLVSCAEGAKKVTSILSGIVDLHFAVIRMSTEMHHNIFTMHFLVKDASSKPNAHINLESDSSEVSPNRGNPTVLREGLTLVLRNLDVKKRGEAYMIIEPLTHGVGLFGEVTHAAELLMAPQSPDLQPVQLTVSVKDHMYTSSKIVRKDYVGVLRYVTKWMEEQNFTPISLTFEQATVEQLCIVFAARALSDEKIQDHLNEVIALISALGVEGKAGMTRADADDKIYSKQFGGVDKSEAPVADKSEFPVADGCEVPIGDGSEMPVRV